jgi:hypothetical protein
MSRRPSMYAGTFCFLDYNTVARVNDDENVIETHKIFRADDGNVSLEHFGVFVIPQVMSAIGKFERPQWIGDHPSVSTTSPVVWPEHFNHHSSCLPFRSSLESSVVSLSLYSGIVMMIIPRAELLRPGSNRNRCHLTKSSFRLFHRNQNEYAISGMRLITTELEVYDFNNARVQRALTLQQAERATFHWQQRGAPYPVFESESMEYPYLTESTLPSCHTLPVNWPKLTYDNILADDEFIVGLWYKVECPIV